jgi:uncharacterized membrane protein YkoI
MTKPNFNRTFVAAAIAAGLLLGVGGLAAASAQSDPGTSQTETNDIDNDDSQDPSYPASITYTEVDGQSEADEAADLARLATISADEAQAAAQAVVPGTVDKVELDNENGAVVYSVEISDGNGGHIDVKVDAGNGNVVHQDTDTDD